MARRFSAPTTASTFAHLRLSFSCSPWASSSVSSATSSSSFGFSSSSNSDTGEAALVIDWNRRAVLDAPVDVVDIDVLAEHGRSVHVVRLDRRPCEADKGGVRQGVTKVLGEAIGDFAGLALHLGSEAVLTAVCLVGDHDDVPAVCQHRVVRFAAAPGANFWDGGEPPRPPRGGVRTFCKSSRLSACCGVCRTRSRHIAKVPNSWSSRSLRSVIYDDGWVLHRRVRDDLPSVEGHEPGSCQSPAYARSRRCGRSPSGLAAPIVLSTAWSHGMELVIPGHDLDESGPSVPEHGEVPNQGQEPGLLEHALDDGPELR